MLDRKQARPKLVRANPSEEIAKLLGQKCLVQLRASLPQEEKLGWDPTEQEFKK